MDKVDTIITSLQFIVIPIASIRVMMYILSISSDPDNAHSYKKRIKNVLWYCVLAEIVLPIIKLFSGYMV